MDISAGMASSPTSAVTLQLATYHVLRSVEPVHRFLEDAGVTAYVRVVHAGPPHGASQTQTPEALQTPFSEHSKSVEHELWLCAPTSSAQTKTAARMAVEGLRLYTNFSFFFIFPGCGFGGPAGYRSVLIGTILSAPLQLCHAARRRAVLLLAQFLFVPRAHSFEPQGRGLRVHAGAPRARRRRAAERGARGAAPGRLAARAAH